jgi:hypothetical protein
MLDTSRLFNMFLVQGCGTRQLILSAGQPFLILVPFGFLVMLDIGIVYFLNKIHTSQTSFLQMIKQREIK